MAVMLVKTPGIGVCRLWCGRIGKEGTPASAKNRIGIFMYYFEHSAIIRN